MPDEANDTDVHFLGMMIPYHRQAIDMSETLLADPATDPDVRDPAERIRDGQQAENDRMNAWAGEWGQQEWSTTPTTSPTGCSIPPCRGTSRSWRRMSCRPASSS